MPAFPECMTTRSGKPYKKATMEEMQGMLKLLAEDRRRREDEIATEKAQEKMNSRKNGLGLMKKDRFVSGRIEGRWKRCRHTWRLS